MAKTLGCGDKSQCVAEHHKEQALTHLEHPSISTTVTAHPNSSGGTKGTDLALLGINGTPTLGSECHQQAGTSVQGHSLEPSHIHSSCWGISGRHRK